MTQSLSPRVSPVENEIRPSVRRGLSIPSITVLDPEGNIIEEEQRKLFRHNAQQGKGADIIFAVGTTGEFNRITNTERRRLIAILADEIQKINQPVGKERRKQIEGWVGVTAETKLLTLENIECALEHGADAVVIAPLSIGDLDDVVSFFHREISDFFERSGHYLPVFLYDNRDIVVDPKRQHIRTFDVKRLSRLPFVFGIKVSASRRVLGNYMRGASHYNDQGEFGIYIGTAMLIFDVFRLERSLWGSVKEYWNRFLMHDTLPVGVVSGPGNVLPREWRRAWHAAYTGDDDLLSIYRKIFKRFEIACRFSDQYSSQDKIIDKALACFKHALVLDDIITSDHVADGTPTLTEEERSKFADLYLKIKSDITQSCPANWISKKMV
jgi:dihydrodipicolinate synthase/N-acetylneuraminate lyase